MPNEILYTAVPPGPDRAHPIASLANYVHIIVPYLSFEEFKQLRLVSRDLDNACMFYLIEGHSLLRSRDKDEVYIKMGQITTPHILGILLSLKVDTENLYVLLYLIRYSQ